MSTGHLARFRQSLTGGDNLYVCQPSFLRKSLNCQGTRRYAVAIYCAERWRCFDVGSNQSGRIMRGRREAAREAALKRKEMR
jgi:hypothetical protein